MKKLSTIKNIVLAALIASCSPSAPIKNFTARDIQREELLTARQDFHSLIVDNLLGKKDSLRLHGEAGPEPFSRFQDSIEAFRHQSHALLPVEIKGWASRDPKTASELFTSQPKAEFCRDIQRRFIAAHGEGRHGHGDAWMIEFENYDCLFDI